MALPEKKRRKESLSIIAQLRERGAPYPGAAAEEEALDSPESSEEEEYDEYPSMLESRENPSPRRAKRRKRNPEGFEPTY